MKDFINALRLSIKNDKNVPTSILNSFIKDLQDSFENREIDNDGKLDTDYVITNKNNFFANADIRKKIIKSMRINEYNLIPSNKKGACYPALVVLALAGVNAEEGFDKTMVKVVKHWFDCKNKYTIIITKDWSQKHLQKWIPVIESYKRMHKASVVIKQYTSYSCSFTDKYS